MFIALTFFNRFALQRSAINQDLGAINMLLLRSKSLSSAPFRTD